MRTSSPRNVMVKQVVIPSEILSDVASLKIYKNTIIRIIVIMVLLIRHAKK